MKLKPTLAVSLFAIMAAFSINASAAADTPAGATAASDAPVDVKAEKVPVQKYCRSVLMRYWLLECTAV